MTVFSETVTKVVLENCLRVTFRRVPGSRTLSLGLFVDHGVKDEDPDVNGISHFIEHVSFNYKNMDRRAKELLGMLMDHGAMYEAYTGKEMTRCSLAAQRLYLPEMIEAMSHIVMNCNTLEENVEHERVIILQEADQYFNSGRVKEELIEQALFGNRSLGLFVIGNRKNISVFTPDQIQERFTSFYSPHNTQLIVQGDVEPEEVMQHVSRAFGHWRNNTQVTKDVFIEVEPSIVGIGNNHRVDLTVAFVGPSFHSRERSTLNLLSDILGNGLKSRLFVELREQKELAYSIYSYAMSYALSGYLAINANCSKDKLPAIYQGILDILEGIKQNGVTEEELRRVKAMRVTNLMQIPNDARKHMQLTGRYALQNKDFFVDLERHELESVTSTDIQNLAHTMLVEDRMGLSAIGVNSEELSALL